MGICQVRHRAASWRILTVLTIIAEETVSENGQ
jgi:hypothetical protein